MKKLAVILLILMLSSPLMAGDVLDSLRDYRVGIKFTLDVDSAETNYMSDNAMDFLIRQAIVTVNPLIRGSKLKQTFVTTYKQSTYTLNGTDTLVGIISVLWSKNDKVKPLKPLAMAGWSDLVVGSTVGQSGEMARRPSFYDYIDGELYLYPTPTLVGDTIRVVGWKKLGGLKTATDLTAIKQAYRIPVLQCAVWLVARAKQHPLTEVFHKDFIESMSMLNQALNTRRQVEISTPPTN